MTARGLHYGLSLLCPWSPTAAKGSGLTVTSKFSLDNPLPCISISSGITPPLMTRSHPPAEAKPTVFSKCQCDYSSRLPPAGPGACKCESEDLRNSLQVSFNPHEVAAPVTQVEAECPRSKPAAAPGAGGAHVHSGTASSQRRQEISNARPRGCNGAVP